MGFLGVSDDRLRHVRQVGVRAQELSRELFGWGPAKTQEMFLLGFLHDFGYQFSVRQDCHEQVGGDILGRCGYKYWREVFHHGDPDSPYRSDELFVLNLADMQTASDGTRVTLSERLADIESRYGGGSSQYLRAQLLAGRLRQRLLELGFTSDLF